MQQAQFTADMIVLPLVCCDLILGIQWLKTLGPILWDFAKLQMEFTTNGRKFTLRGAKTPPLKLINNKSFAQAVQKGAELCFLNVANVDYPFMVPTCHVLQASDSTVSLPPAFEQLYWVIMLIFLLNLLYYPLLVLVLITKFHLKKEFNPSIYALIVFHWCRKM